MPQIVHKVGTWHATLAPDPGLGGNTWQWDAELQKPVAEVTREQGQAFITGSPDLYVWRDELEAPKPLPVTPGRKSRKKEGSP